MLFIKLLLFLVLLTAGTFAYRRFDGEEIEKMFDEEQDVAKRSSRSYKVEGCFKDFITSADTWEAMGNAASNVKCQDICKDKGYILAGTRGQYCFCKNIYPKGKQVADSECRTRCRSFLQCYSAQECCGGSNAYTVSVVGNIDVAKQVLRRLAHLWRSHSGYRNHMMQYVKQPPVTNKGGNWWGSFDHKGWSTCPGGHYITGFWRNSCNSLYCLEQADCKSAASHLYSGGEQDCYHHDIWGAFDHKGLLIYIQTTLTDQKLKTC